MDLKKCDKKKCNPTLKDVDGKFDVSCDCGMGTFNYSSPELAKMAWNNDKTFQFGKKEEIKTEEVKKEDKAD